jgi:hypothetical protein
MAGVVEFLPRRSRIGEMISPAARVVTIRAVPPVPAVQTPSAVFRIWTAQVGNRHPHHSGLAGPMGATEVLDRSMQLNGLSCFVVRAAVGPF